MLTRRETLKYAVTAAAVVTAGRSAFAAAQQLDWQVFQAGEEGFRRTPVLLSGETEAILIDGGFTLSDGRALAEAIKATGKKLTTIYVSCSDPDYYFGLGPVVEAFPEANVIAKTVTVEAINGNVESKLATWGPMLKDNGPQKLADVVIPTPSDVSSLALEGQDIDIVEISSMHDRRYLWVPSLEAVFGGVLVSSGIHVWVADTPTPEERAAWVDALNEIIARQPKIVVPGHKTEDAPGGVEAVTFTRDYLVAFDEELKKANDSAALIAAMAVRYPDLEGVSSLELGAKVAMGEMKWG
ncbi:MBL fold metallo-hydrolase [uncultured Martelella sp.]|uniref:MBL fold metallo-hydrolase n=1 Tax=uncultured Martelella sp. TaxID=392331 RepID=UPI0029C65031|nr:MBL fold metallo-hydrolase [uncultured Martelella sp.]